MDISIDERTQKGYFLRISLWPKKRTRSFDDNGNRRFCKKRHARSVLTSYPGNTVKNGTAVTKTEKTQLGSCSCWGYQLRSERGAGLKMLITH